MNRENTTVVVCVYNEDTSFTQRIPLPTQLYFNHNLSSPHKENQTSDIPNKGHEALVYLKHVIEQYDSLSEYTVFLHCHEYSWHHTGSIVDILHTQMNKPHTFTNLNNYTLGNMENLDTSTNPIGEYFRRLIRPAVGWNAMYPNFTAGVLGCAQFIVHKDNILYHSKQFYQQLYTWLVETELSNHWSGRFLEWTWELFWNRCLNNVAIRVYQGESVVAATRKPPNNQTNTDTDTNTDTKEQLLHAISTALDNHDFYLIDTPLLLVTNHHVHECHPGQYIYNKYV